MYVYINEPFRVSSFNIMFGNDSILIEKMGDVSLSLEYEIMTEWYPMNPPHAGLFKLKGSKTPLMNIAKLGNEHPTVEDLYKTIVFHSERGITKIIDPSDNLLTIHKMLWEV